ncbi:MAG TPA: serine/threonine-protein kinase [Polyangia bacterium]|nr:serine/threonine-protein kinase [Polyangia bacterium]
MIELGQTVGNYRIASKIGEGGMGTVYLAEHPVIGRKAALKVIDPKHSRNADVVARFVNEATAISRIGHEHIVEVTDFGRTPKGDFYFIMEYLEGETLADVIAREAPLDPARAIGIAAQIADALAAAHASGVIHRDLKPDNIHLVTRGEDTAFVKVLDFGLAKLVHDDGSPTKTRAGMIMGTPYYMSPEQCQGAPGLDARADVYSLGVVLFEMLTGKLPFGGGGYAEVFMKQISMRAPVASSLVSSVPRELDALLHKALDKNPDARFQTMKEFRDALLSPESALPHAVVHDDRSRRLRAAGPMSRTELAQREGTVDWHIPRRRGPRNFIILAAATLVGTFVAARLTRGSLEPRPPAAVTAAPAPAPAPAAPPTVVAHEVVPSSPPAAEIDDDPPAPTPAAEAPRAATAPAGHHHHRERREPAVPIIDDGADEDAILPPSFR